jgi:hypothetical protein
MATWLQINPQDGNATYNNVTVYNTIIANSISGSFTGSYSETDPIFVSQSASLATTGSNIFIGNQYITGSILVSGSAYFPGLTNSSQSGIVVIDPTTGQLYYTTGSISGTSGTSGITPLYNGTSSNCITLPLTLCNNSVPICNNKVLVFQVCNSNSEKDDNFDVYLNGAYIGALDLNYNSQVGSVFIANLDPLLAITEPNFVCPMELIQVYRFNPLILNSINTIELRNTQSNNNGNYGIIGVSNYEISGSSLVNPCQIANIEYSGNTGQSFFLNFEYQDCCATLPSTIEIDLDTNINGAVVTMYPYSIDTQNYIVDWGDGSPVDESTTEYFVHTYESTGSYTITVSFENKLILYDIDLYSNNGETSIYDIRNLRDFQALRTLTLDNVAFNIETVQMPINLSLLYLYFSQIANVDLRSIPSLVQEIIEDSEIVTSINSSGITNLEFISIMDYSLTLPNLTYVNINNCAVVQSSIDNLLVNLDSNGLSNGYVTALSGSNQPPSSTGLTAKANLISKGWTVLTN